MNRSNRRAVTITATLAALMLGTYGQTAFAAGDDEPIHEANASTTSRPDAAGACNERTGRPDAPLTLLVQPPTGGTVRLTYVPVDGWKLDTPNATPQDNQGRVTTVAASQAQASRGKGEPMTVFIDGPSGFTYIWKQDQGWTFAGRITDRMQ